MKALKDILLAFVIGGAFCVLGQLFTIFWVGTLGPGPYTGMIVLLSMGVVGALMFAFGIHQPINDIAGYGTILPFNGFCAAVAGVYCGGKQETGTHGGAFKTAATFVAKVVGAGVGIALLITIIAFFVMGAPGAPVPGPQISVIEQLIRAFLLGGIVCAIFQIFMIITKLAPPPTLIGGIALGAILAMTGIAGAAVGWGGAGYDILVIGAGTGVYNTLMMLLGAGNPVPFIALVGLFIVLTLLGSLAGAAYLALHKEDKEA